MNDNSLNNRKANELSTTAKWMGLSHIIVLFGSLGFFFQGMQFESAWTLAFAYIIQIQANHLVERSYRLRGF